MTSPSTTRLGIALLAPNQGLKYITHNEGLVDLDVMVQTSISGIVETLPITPEPGECVRLSTDLLLHSDNGKMDEIAVFDTDWRFYPPREGWLCWNEQTAQMEIYSDGAWQSLPITKVERFGINVDADLNNQLTVKGATSLFDAETNSCRVTINRHSSSDTASLLFGTGYTANAEIGLVGGNDIAIKVSEDGEWKTALSISLKDGSVTLNGGAPLLDTDQSLIRLGSEIPAGANLNDYVKTGIYGQTKNSGAAGGLNYPVARAGILEVIASGTTVYQRYRDYQNNHNFTRTRSGETFRHWRDTFS